MAFPFWIIPSIIGALGLFKGGGGGGNDGQGGIQEGFSGIDPTLNAIYPDLQRLMAFQQRQALFTDPGSAPLFGMNAPEGSVPLQLALARLAFSLLPVSAQQTPISPSDPLTPKALCGGVGQPPCGPGVNFPDTDYCRKACSGQIPGAPTQGCNCDGG